MNAGVRATVIAGLWPAVGACRMKPGAFATGLGAAVSSRAMKVMLTGAAGFIGRALCAELNAVGHEVSALVRQPGSAPENVTPSPA